MAHPQPNQNRDQGRGHAQHPPLNPAIEAQAAHLLRVRAHDHARDRDQGAQLSRLMVRDRRREKEM